MKLHVGCAMWSYGPWQGRYLPASLSPRERLRAYATWCNAVEGNTTFYATPALDTVTSWAGQTAPDFRFDLPPGSWAVSAYEDKNDNGVLDMGLFGPKEPSGFWRPFSGWHKPKFDEVAASITRDTRDADVTLK